VAALVATASVVLSARDADYPRPTSTDRALYLRSGRVVHALALSFDALAADVYWIRTVQHYGGDRLTRPAHGQFELLQPLLDLTTTLDPHFVVAYRFGAIFLSEAPPGGPGRPDQAVRLLEKGLRADPARWQYAHDIGFVYLWYVAQSAPTRESRQQAMKTAADWFGKAAAMPHAPNWLRPLAATTLGGADRTAARVSLLDMAANADQPWIRQSALRRLAQLQALDEIDALQAIVDRAHAERGVWPASWLDLMRARLLRGEPLDPAGAMFDYDASSGRVSLSTRSPLAPLPVQFERR
jgi:hypothetical protein